MPASEQRLAPQMARNIGAMGNACSSREGGLRVMQYGHSQPRPQASRAPMISHGGACGYLAAVPHSGCLAAAWRRIILKYRILVSLAESRVSYDKFSQLHGQGRGFWLDAGPSCDSLVSKDGSRELGGSE